MSRKWVAESGELRRAAVVTQDRKMRSVRIVGIRSKVRIVKISRKVLVI